MNFHPTKDYFRQRQRNRLYEDVVKAIEKSAAERGVRRKDIAESLDVSQSQVSRWLSGPANWGIDTVSDLLFAVGAELDFIVAWLAERQKKNEFHPRGEPVRDLAQLILSNETGNRNVNKVALPTRSIISSSSRVQ